MTDSALVKNAEKTPGSKVGLTKVAMFFSKGRHGTSPEDMIQKLLQENRKLRKELKSANSRLLELEVAAALSTTIMTATSTENAPDDNTIEFTEDPSDDRDDNAHTYGGVAHQDSDDFSVEVEASAFMKQHQRQKSVDFDDIQSATGSACTIPTGNDKKSKRFRHQLDLRRRMRGGRSTSSRHSNNNGTASNRYFSRNEDAVHSPMETITEIRTQPKNDKNLLDAYGVVDLISTTSDLSSSVASSTRSDSILVSAHDGALLSGKMLPLQAMRSLLRISASDSDSDELSAELVEEESPLFGEI